MTAEPVPMSTTSETRPVRRADTTRPARPGARRQRRIRSGVDHRPLGTPRPEPGAELRSLAHLLEAQLARGRRHPSRWQAPAFAREVDLVRAHLRPIHSLEMLAASYGRESLHAVLPAAKVGLGAVGVLGRSATEVGYALRWLEIGGSIEPSPWPTLLGSRGLD